MNFETINLNELIPSEYNPRLITPEEQKRLARNLEEFGLVDPIIVNLKNNHIIGGHQRYKVLTQNGDNDKEFSMIRLGDIGWVFNNESLTITDDNHEKALNLALNKISGDWDYGKLSDVLEDLQVSNFNMDLTGFGELELNKFNLSPTPSLLPEQEMSDTHNTTLPDDNVTVTKDTLTSDKNIFLEEEEEEEEDGDGTVQPVIKEVAFKEFYVLEVELPSEQELEKVYEQMTKEGYKCRVLTL